MNPVPGNPPGTDTLDSGIARAGEATAARRRELNISQRSLAGDGVITAGALIAFEKGRSWPRQRTRAKLEAALQWPPGMIAGIRAGAAAPETVPAAAIEPGPPVTAATGTPAMAQRPANGESELIARVLTASVDNCRLAAEALPPSADPRFTTLLGQVTAELRRLDSVAAQSIDIYGPTPELLQALSTVRRYHRKLVLQGATAPTATLGQRLYAGRHRANLSATEVARAAGVSEGDVHRAESDEQLPADVTRALTAVLTTMDWP